ncbi:MAG: hypothetical protein HQK76_17555 [Desulfobacterales bacterium]|nr:hypothetical protein [Desulfobacterales bacterium]
MADKAKLNKLAKKILDDEVIDEEEVEEIRELIYKDGNIDREEADFLFKLNDDSVGSENDPSWKELFVEALTDYVLKDEKSPDVLDAEEAAYLIKKIKANGIVDENELALMANITSKATECDKSFNEFILSSLKEIILENKVVFEHEVEMIKNIIYGEGSGGGSSVDREEADFLFELNKGTSEEENCPEWKDLFIEAITKYVLEDKSSPNEIDEKEAEWIISKIEKDGKYDKNEKALLKNLKNKAKKIHPKLKAKLDAL